MRLGFSLCCSQASFIAAALLFFSVFSGCARESDELPLIPPLTHPLAREYIGYGVVNVSFTHLLDEPGKDGVSRSYIRKGTVVRIIERKPVLNGGAPEIWVLAEGNYEGQGTPSNGWLREIDLEVYNNESQAITASGIMNP